MIFRNEFVTNSHNTTAPVDPQHEKIWHGLGLMGEGVWPSKHPVTPIGQRVFVGAKHVGAQVGDKIRYAGKDLAVTKVEPSQTADVNYIFVDEDVAPLPVYNGEKFLIKYQLGTGESINPVFCIGYGFGKFKPVNNNAGQLIGWGSDSTQVKRWGINYINEIDFGTPHQIPTIKCRFQIGTYEDFHCTMYDSGGPAFVLCEDGIWRFIGVIHSDGGQPAIFGKIGTVVSMINLDLDYINSILGSKPVKVVEPVEKDGVVENSFDYDGRSSKSIVVEVYQVTDGVRKLISSQETKL